ncbi:MAG: WG repeat-containing protein [Desulfococcaceae bacterium]
MDNFILFPFWAKKGCGYFDDKYNIVINPEFNDFSHFSEGLAVISDPKTGLKGYINEKGKTVIFPRFEEAAPFKEGMARVSLKERSGWKSGFIDKTGNMVIPMLYWRAENFSEEHGVVMTDPEGKYGFINKKGKFVIPEQYDAASDFSESMSAVKIENKWGFIDKNGRLRIPAIYDYASSFSEDFAAVNIGGNLCFMPPKGGNWTYIDKTGKTVTEPFPFNSLGDFHEGYAAFSLPYEFVEIASENSFILRKNRRLTAISQYKKICKKILGVFKTEIRNRNDYYGYLNKKGEIVIKPEYYRADDFSEGLAAVSVFSDWETNRIGFVNKAGELVIPAKYEAVSGFKNGLSWVARELDNRCLYIDKTGKTVWPPYYNFYDSI